MSSIPYNSKSYLDAKVAMTDNGTVDAGRQMQSPASAGSRGLAKTMTFSKNKTQMQLGQEAIAESMVDIRNILNRIDGVNVPTNEMNELADNDKMEFTKLLLDMSVMKDRVQALSVDEDAKASAIQSLTSAEEALVALDEAESSIKEESDYLYLRGKEIDQGSIVYDMQDYSDGIFELQKANYADGTELDEKELEELESTQELIDWVMIDFVSESAVQEDAGEDEKVVDMLRKIKQHLDNHPNMNEHPSLVALDQLADDLESGDKPADYESAVQEDAGDIKQQLGPVAKEVEMFRAKQKELFTTIVDALSQDGTGLNPTPEAEKLAMKMLSFNPKDVDHYSPFNKESAVEEDSGELARLKELSGIEEDTNDDLMQWAKKYSQYKNLEDDNLIEALYDFAFDLGITQFIFEVGELQAAEQKLGKKQEDWEDAEINAAMEMSPISNGLIDDLHRILPGNAELEQKLDSIRGMLEKAGLKEDKYQPMPEGDEFDIEEDEDFEEVLGSLGFPEDETELFDAEYQGRKVPLNKPMRGDSKKFKVYVKDPKTGNVKKVNFGHGGTSAKKAGQKTMKIRKSNPKARKSFRARHNCANPGPKTKARYWSCRAW